MLSKLSEQKREDKRKIELFLNKLGISSDLIDINAEFDSTLNLTENLQHFQDSFIAPRLSEVLA